jgi:hypothetical protein
MRFRTQLGRDYALSQSPFSPSKRWRLAARTDATGFAKSRAQTKRSLAGRSNNKGTARTQNDNAFASRATNLICAPDEKSSLRRCSCREHSIFFVLLYKQRHTHKVQRVQRFSDCDEAD